MYYKNNDLSAYGNNIKRITNDEYIQLLVDGHIHFYNGMSLYSIYARTRIDKVAILEIKENIFIVKLNISEKGEEYEKKN